MSYDYILIRGGDEDGFDMLAAMAMSEPIGLLSDVKTQISRMFPAVQWRTTKASLPPGLCTEGIFGNSGALQFQLSTSPDGMVNMITMSRAEKDEVQLVASSLHLVAIDEQSMEAFGG